MRPRCPKRFRLSVKRGGRRLWPNEARTVKLNWIFPRSSWTRLCLSFVYQRSESVLSFSLSILAGQASSAAGRGLCLGVDIFRLLAALSATHTHDYGGLRSRWQAAYRAERSQGHSDGRAEQGLLAAELRPAESSSMNAGGAVSVSLKRRPAATGAALYARDSPSAAPWRRS